MAAVDRSPLESWLTIEEWSLPTTLTASDRLARRRRALLELDPLVRRQLRAIGASLPPQTIELTVYDAVYAASPEAGGHWTAVSTWLGLISHAINSYSVVLHFDEYDQPDHFVVSGAASCASNGVSEAALGRALEQAAVAGPNLSLAPHLFQSVGL